MHSIAQEINQKIIKHAPQYYSLLSDMGKNLYMPRGILYQTAEAQKQAFQYNATIGMATEAGNPMILKSIRHYFKGLSDEEIFNYAPSAGDLKLREKWQAMIYEKNQFPGGFDISLPVVTNGITHALMVFADLFVDPDDEIIIPEKLWGNYHLIFGLRKKAALLQYPFFNEELTGFNITAFEKILQNSKKEKMIILFNFPNNPTGYTPLLQEADQIIAIIKKYAEAGKKIIVLTDDAYFGLFYDQKISPSTIFARLARVHENILPVKVDGITKEDFAWGFRIGFITFADFNQNNQVYQALEQKAAASVRSSTSNCSRPIQSILNHIYQDKDYEQQKEEKFNILSERAKKVAEIVYQEKYQDCWTVYPFNSGYFMCLQVKGVAAEAVRQHALTKYGIGIIALENDLRVAFSCIEKQDLAAVFDLIAQSIRELKDQ